MHMSSDRFWPRRGWVLAGQMSTVLQHIASILCSFPGCQGLALANMLKGLARIPSRLCSLGRRGDWHVYPSCVYLDHSDNILIWEGSVTPWWPFILVYDKLIIFDLPNPESRGWVFYFMCQVPLTLIIFLKSVQHWGMWDWHLKPPHSLDNL